jgi:hypothetical protein
LGPLSFHQVSHFCPEATTPCSTRRARRCLLKDCECLFIPSCPQSRYCSKACQQAARRWRRVKASRAHRADPDGREQRRRHNRLYRQRRRARVTAAAAARPPSSTPAREGKRPACSCEFFHERMCDRPGCYVTFTVRHECSCQRFCSLACRLALRRVLDRERRYRSRRGCGRRRTCPGRPRRLDSS